MIYEKLKNTIEADSVHSEFEERLQVAQNYVKAGFNIFPLGRNKRPAVDKWEPYRSAAADNELLEQWFIKDEKLGIAIVCGAGKIKPIIFDFEYEYIFIDWCNALFFQGKKSLISSLPVVRTPGGGVHLYVRLDGLPPAGTHLAKRIVDGKEDLLIETRGTGHYVVAPGSAAACHDANKCYQIYRGKIEDTPIITRNDFDLFIEVAKSMDQMKKIAPSEPDQNDRSGVVHKPWESPVIRDFNESKQLPVFLHEEGFKLIREAAAETYWQKPKSSDSGHHITFNLNDDGKVRCFSASCPPFEEGKTYSGFEAFALLKHDGDESSAEIDLKEEGYGLDSWLEPSEIKTSVLEAPAMTQEMLPTPIRGFCTDISKRMQTPLEGIAISVMTAIGSLVGAGCAMRPEEYGDHFVVPNLWGMLVGRPGVILKSPTLSKGLAPLKRLQNREREVFARKDNEYLRLKDEYELQLDKLKKAAKSKDTNAMDKYRTAKLLLTEPVKPIQKRYISNEASPQKLVEILSGNPRGILKEHDELSGFISMLDQDSQREQRAFYLTAWNGYGSYDDDKIGRGSTSAPNLCISILGGIQPDMLQAVLLQAFSKKGLKPAASDGFVPRFQLAVWPEELERGYVDLVPDVKAAQRIQTIFETLDSMTFADFGATDSADEKFPYFQFTPEAQVMYGPWVTALESKIRIEQNSVMQEHLSKYRSLLPSLALLFHLIYVADDSKAAGNGVSLDAFNLAASWCEFLEKHARKIYSLIDGAPLCAVTQIVNKIGTKELRDGFSKRVIDRHKWKFLTENATIENALAELVNAGWLIERRTAAGFQSPEKVTYLINPKISMRVN